MHCYKTLEWWIIFRCQYTLTSNESITGLFEPTLSGTIFRRGCCRKTQLCDQDKVNASSAIAKSIRVVDRDIKFANNFITSW